MINLLEMIPLRWNKANKKYFESRGYEFTNYGDEFLVYIKDLRNGSEVKVPVQCDCDDCKNGILFTPYSNYNKLVSKNGLYKCHQCALKDNAKKRNNDNKVQYYNIFLDKCKQYNCTPLTTFDDFSGLQSYVSYICPIHGEVKTNVSGMVYNDSWCYQCGIDRTAKAKRLPILEVKEYIETKNNNILLNPEDYIDTNTKNLKVICGSCGNTFLTSLGSMKNSNGRCHDCGSRIYGQSIKTTKEDIIQLSFFNGQQMVINPEEYIDMETELYFKCHNCGEAFLTKPRYYLRLGFCRCEKCRKYSKGENLIASFLDQHKISYIRQKKYDDCVDKHVLPFDFYLADYNCLIEYNGAQHYYPVDYFGGEEAFIVRQKHDEIKCKYAHENGIDLLVIPYIEFNNIETILTEKFLE